MTTRIVEVSNREDVIDVRDIIARFEQLSDEKESTEAAEWPEDDEQELSTLATLLDDLKGNGGDEQWRGDWYPITLVRDDYFTDYAQQLAEEIGAISSDSHWPNNCIDWEKAARELKVDYSTVEFDGVTYWYR